MRIQKLTAPKLNILSTFSNQIVATACGIVVPRILIGAYGSEAYGITVSITQFLSYIALLESGIGGVARAQMYSPLARRDYDEVGAVYHATKRFFRLVGLVFLLYSVGLALSFHRLAGIQSFSWSFIFILVLIISGATLAKYMIGLANLTLIVADQKQYICKLITVGATVMNTAGIVLMVGIGADLLWVKLGSSLVFILPPILYALYVKRHYPLPKIRTKKAVLEQKWTGIGQHIAYFLHSNTDVVLLTLLADLRLVAVYAVYHLVINSIRSITESFSGGMEAAFGEMLAKGEQARLLRAFRKYKTLLYSVTLVLFGCTGILIVSFVRLYTNGITDVNYIQPAFAMILLFAEALNCLCLPFSSLPIAANQLKQTRWGAYGEALINIVLSVGLIFWKPLIGVVLATLAATVFRTLYYLIYSSRHYLRLPVRRLLLELCGILLLLALVILAGNKLMLLLRVENYLDWALCGLACFTALAAPVSVFVLPRFRQNSQKSRALTPD